MALPAMAMWWKDSYANGEIDFQVLNWLFLCLLIRLLFVQEMELAIGSLAM